ncbi:MAG TPA: DPP IV N-terminal domain-containing protein [Candidatus Acidoferrales bacterium]|nr:DPP IV N-terminal domain-containing protein [Candidatus Acidoferrales bacterium]
MKSLRWILTALLTALMAVPAVAQGSLEDYQRAQRFLPGNVRHLVIDGSVSPNWIGKSSRFWYRETLAKGSQFILVDPEKNTSGPAFDHARIATSLSHSLGHPVQPTELPFDAFNFSDDGSAIQFELDNAQWTCKLADYECTKQAAAPADPYERLSPNGRWAAYVQDHNLFLRDTSTGTILQLTRDGVAGDDYATPLPSLRLLVEQGTDNPKERVGVFWSPDSSKLVTYRMDSWNAGRFTSLQFVPPGQIRPKAYTVVYPLPGEVLPAAQPIIIDVQTGKQIEVKTPPLEMQFQGGVFFDWLPDSKHFYYDYDARGEKQIEVREVDAATGEQRVMVQESTETYVDPGETFFRLIHDGEEVLWSSERDGWNQLYLHNGKTGQLENQVTHGDWVVRQIAAVDEKARQVYFLASGREKDEDPYLTHLYRVNFDGNSLQLLTPGNANHTVSVSPDDKFFVDNYSRPDLPGESVLCRTDGSTVRVLEKTDDSALLKTGWKYPTPFEGKAGDGTTDLYGLIWRPSNFDPAKKYPVIEQVYTGPQGFFVPKSFRGSYFGSEQPIAELGFVVVMVDGRGTTGRSRAFHEYSYRNLGGSFADHVALIKQMGAKYPYMDLTRVGIYGTSAGGYGSAHAILQFPDFYKVCVSTSGDHDARLDKAWWNELYQGYPVEKDYEEQANESLAGKLEGHLLLIHGDVDDNVHPVETMRLVDALMTANKKFDMLFVPNMFHGDSGPHAHYVTLRRWDYFVQYLLGVTPPKDFQIKEERLPPFRGR